MKTFLCGLCAAVLALSASVSNACPVSVGVVAAPVAVAYAQSVAVQVAAPVVVAAPVYAMPQVLLAAPVYSSVLVQSSAAVVQVNSGARVRVHRGLFGGTVVRVH